MHAGTDGGSETPCARGEQLHGRREHAVVGRSQTHDVGQPGGAARRLELVAGHKFWSTVDAGESRNGTVCGKWRREEAEHNAHERE